MPPLPPVALWMARIAVGLVFIVAGAEKVTAPVDFSKAIAGYRLLSPFWTSVTALVLPWVEILAGACVLVGFMAESAALLTSLMAAGFGVAVVSALARGLDIRCGCFHDQSNVSWLHVGLDLLLLAAALIVLADARKRRLTDGGAPGSDRGARP